ncbi:golgin subfamily A member 6-like protein 22 [Cotesia glomerata]|uniref:golgin subfamily A member 6-like protein 22 n=1 Tax=Cotesia glomerata TaxID=32391 RepID=UPI001D01FF81|nr:golgin subfamily A member 6-like protein 22 [Cotesia glomerata]
MSENVDGSRFEVREIIKGNDENSSEEWAEDGDSWSEIDGEEGKKANERSKRSASAGREKSKRGRPAKDGKVARDFKRGEMKGAMEKYITGFKTSYEIKRTPLKGTGVERRVEQQESERNRNEEGGKTNVNDEKDKINDDETVKTREMEKKKAEESKGSDTVARNQSAGESDGDAGEEPWERKLEQMRKIMIERQEEVLEGIYKKLSKVTECRCKCVEVRKEDEKKMRRELEFCRDGIVKREKMLMDKEAEIERLTETLKIETDMKHELEENLRKEKEKRRSDKRDRGKEEDKESNGRNEMEKGTENLLIVARSRDEKRKEAQRAEIWKKEERKKGQIRVECTNMREKKEIMENRRIMKGTGIWIMEEKTKRERDVELWIRKIAKLEQYNGSEVEIDEKRLKIEGNWKSWNEKKGDLVD